MHLLEYEVIGMQLWDERLKSFQKEIVDQAQRVKQKHSAELQHLKESWASKNRVKAQWSTELLIQRRIQVAWSHFCIGKEMMFIYVNICIKNKKI